MTSPKGLLRQFARRLAARYFPLRSEFDFADVQPQEWSILRAVGPYTLQSTERLLALLRAIDHLEHHRIEGAIVECGVYRGGSAMAAALKLIALDRVQRDLYLFDTFEGMVAPGAADLDLFGKPAAEEFARHRIDDQSSTWTRATLDAVQQNVQGTGYPRERLFFVQGRVEQTLPAAGPERIALLRLDTDWYESTRHELEHLYPRLVPGGVLMVDDYGHYQGAARAVDEYLAQLPYPLHLSRIDYTGRIVTKPPAAS